MPKQLSLFDMPSTRRVGRGRPRKVRPIVSCASCGARFAKYPSAIEVSKSKRFLCTDCLHKARLNGMRPRKREYVDLDRFHNGRRARIDPWFGYVLVYEPNHPQSTKRHRHRRSWFYEHRVVIERIIGRPLAKGEVVHHVNGVKTDNRPENLRLMNRTDHTKLHEAQRVEQLERLAEYERRFGPLTPTTDGPVITIEHFLPVTKAMLDDYTRSRGSLPN